MIEGLYQNLIVRFFSLLRTHELYPPDNEVAQKARKHFLALIHQLCEEQALSDVLLEHTGDFFCVNRRLIKPDLGSLVHFSRLSLRLNKVNLAMVRFRKNLSEEELVRFASNFKEDLYGKTPKYLSQASFASISLAFGREGEEAVEYWMKLSNLKDVLVKLLILNRQFLREIKEGKSPSIIYLRRMVHELLEAVEDFGKASLVFLWLGYRSRDERDISLFRAFLASAFGHFLNLSRIDKEYLVLGSLTASIGRLILPQEILKKPGALTEEEKKIIQAMQKHSLGLLLHFPTFTPLLAQLFNSASTLCFDSIPNHPLAQISQIIHVYLALIYPKPYRFSYHPAHAREILWKGRGKQYHPQWLSAFLDFLGPYPPGSPWKDGAGKPVLVLEYPSCHAWDQQQWVPHDGQNLTPLPIHRFPVNPLTVFGGKRLDKEYPFR